MPVPKARHIAVLFYMKYTLILTSHVSMSRSFFWSRYKRVHNQNLKEFPVSFGGACISLISYWFSDYIGIPTHSSCMDYTTWNSRGGERSGRGLLENIIMLLYGLRKTIFWVTVICIPVRDSTTIFLVFFFITFVALRKNYVTKPLPPRLEIFFFESEQWHRYYACIPRHFIHAELFVHRFIRFLQHVQSHDHSVYL
jgi:hypothetical protein